MARPHRPVLTAEIIADAAIELIDSGEPFGVNALARALGVKPPSLYNHVQGLEAIIELVRGRLADRYMVDLPAQRAVGRDHRVDHPRRAPHVHLAPACRAADCHQHRDRPAGHHRLRHHRLVACRRRFSRRRGAGARPAFRRVRARVRAWTTRRPTPSGGPRAKPETWGGSWSSNRAERCAATRPSKSGLRCCWPPCASGWRSTCGPRALERDTRPGESAF